MGGKDFPDVHIAQGKNTMALKWSCGSSTNSTYHNFKYNKSDIIWVRNSRMHLDSTGDQNIL